MGPPPVTPPVHWTTGPARPRGVRLHYPIPLRFKLRTNWSGATATPELTVNCPRVGARWRPAASGSGPVILILILNQILRETMTVYAPARAPDGV